MGDLELRLALALSGQIFLFVVLCALLHQRIRIGSGALHMSFAAALFFGCIATAAGLTLPLPGNQEFDFTQVAIIQPLLTVFLLVYITSGVLESQRMLVGALCSYLLFIFFCMTVKLHCTFLPENNMRAVVFTLLNDVKEAVNFNAVRNLLAFLTVPMFYSMLRRLNNRFLRISGALLGAHSVAMIPWLAITMLQGKSIEFWNHANFALLCSILFFAAMAALYLRLLQRDIPDHRHGTWDFLFAFFGSYSRIRELEDDISSWENRYHLVLRHSAEVVVMSDENGRIKEANIAAERVFGSKNLIGRELFSLFKPDTPLTAADVTGKPLYFNCIVGENEEQKILSASISPVKLKKQLLLVMVARDITEEQKLAREKEILAEQLIHSQRMESLGVLAGGIAHDFNNYIHAILGHSDVALMIDKNKPEKVESHLHKIAEIAEKAGRLTGQLLGFARKGKYHVVKIDIPALMSESCSLLDPGKLHHITVKRKFTAATFMRGDQLQIQQVMMNLLINAIDAVAAVPDEKILTLHAGMATDAPLDFTPPPEYSDAEPGKYVYFAVSDNGCGMDEMTKRKIFEPFFTTKPTGQGTGMGLAMVYGTVSHHKGWIQLASAPGEGTTFCIFFPSDAEQ